MLLNTVALSSFDFKAATALLFFQCALCVVLVQACSAAGLVRVEPFNLEIIRIWLPVNAIFVGMIGTSFWALQTLNVGMVTGARRRSRSSSLCPFPARPGPDMLKQIAQSRPTSSPLVALPRHVAAAPASRPP